MATRIAALVQEKGTAVFTVAFTDDAGNAVTPGAATWTLTDKGGNVINSRNGVNISPLGVSVTIVLSGDDLALVSTANSERHLTVEFTYTSDAGSDLPGKSVAVFHIENLVAVT